MKKENLKKLAEIIVSENEDNFDNYSIKDYYDALYFEDAIELEKLLEEEAGDKLYYDEYTPVTIDFLQKMIEEGDLEQGKYLHVAKNKCISYDEFVKEYASYIESAVYFYSCNSINFWVNMVAFFGDDIDLKKIADELYRDGAYISDDDEDSSAIYERLKAGRPIY